MTLKQSQEPEHFWTDGACIPNPGKGGWAWITHKGIFQTGQDPDTTNQRMELMAVISVLRSLEPTFSAIITTDSQYVIKGSTLWMKKWKASGWKGGKGREVINKDLWQALDQLLESRTVTFTWVKSHSGDIMNDKADRLANEATTVPEGIRRKFALSIKQNGRSISALK